jgi:hypothetical protein
MVYLLQRKGSYNALAETGEQIGGNLEFSPVLKHGDNRVKNQ